MVDIKFEAKCVPKDKKVICKVKFNEHEGELESVKDKSGAISLKVRGNKELVKAVEQFSGIIKEKIKG